MSDALTPLLADGVIDEIVSRLKSGKEADIYLVRHGAELLAAKVYKDSHFRSFQNNAAYKEGRSVRNSRTQRAMNKGSRFGRDAAEDAWKTKESDALETLFAAGVRVPKPHLFYEGVLLMEVVVDAEGQPAPRLIDAAIPAARAAELYTDLRSQVIEMLRADLIHGDLSPYNVLLAWNGATLIDFPQVVGAAHNSNAERFFARDLEGLRQFFATLDPALEACAADAHEIWRAYTRRELTRGFVPPRRSAAPVRGGLSDANERPRHRPKEAGPAQPRPGQSPSAPPPQQLPRPGSHPDSGRSAHGQQHDGGRHRRGKGRGPQPQGQRPQGTPPHGVQQERSGRPPTPPTSPVPQRPGKPQGHPRPGAATSPSGPVVTYVGRPIEPTPTPAIGTRKRRRRRRRSGGSPPTAS